MINTTAAIRNPQSTTTVRADISPGAFYSYRDLTHKDSPFFIASGPTLYRAVAAGKLRVHRGAGRPLVKGEDVLAWLEGRTVSAAA